MIGSKAVGVAVCLAIASFAVSQPRSLSESEIKTERKQRWEKFFSDLSRIEQAQLFVPVDPTRSAPDPHSRSLGRMAMVLVSYRLHSAWSLQDGCVAFRPEPRGRKQSGRNWLLEWSSRLDDTSLRALMTKDGFDLGQLSPEDRFSFAANLAMPPDMYEGFMSNSSEAKVSVRFVVDVEFQKTATGRYGSSTGRYRLGRSTRPEWMSMEREPTAPTDPMPISASANETTSGKLDFGPGQIVKVSQIRSMIWKAFGKDVKIDPRIEQSSVFLSGKFDWEKIEKCIDFSLRTRDPEEAIVDTSYLDSIDLAELFSEALDIFSESTGLNADSSMADRTVNGAFVAGFDPGFADLLMKNGIDPNSISVSLIPALLVHVSAPGKTPSEGLDHLGNRTYGSWALHNFTLRIRFP